MQGRLIILESLNHWVFSAPSHTKFLRQYTKYSLADILVLRERKILQAFCGFSLRYLLHLLQSGKFLKNNPKEIRVYFAKVEPRKQMKAVLCVLPNALLVTLQKTPKIQGLPALACRP